MTTLTLWRNFSETATGHVSHPRCNSTAVECSELSVVCLCCAVCDGEDSSTLSVEGCFIPSQQSAQCSRARCLRSSRMCRIRHLCRAAAPTRRRAGDRRSPAPRLLRPAAREGPRQTRQREGRDGLPLQLLHSQGQGRRWASRLRGGKSPRSRPMRSRRSSSIECTTLSCARSQGLSVSSSAF